MVNPRVCKVYLTDVASMAWTATPVHGLQCARDARFGGFAQRSHRHRLPPRTDDYVPGGKRAEGSQDPGTRRTPARWDSAKPAPINGVASCLRGTHEHRACPGSLEHSPQAHTQRVKGLGRKKAAQRLPNAIAAEQ